MVAIAVLAGAVVAPNRALAQSPGIHIAGGTATSPLQLTRGCNLVIAESANGTPVAGLAALTSPPSAVVSIWRFDNATKRYDVGYFADRGAPVDFSAMGSSTTGRGTESYFVCVSSSASILSQ